MSKKKGFFDSASLKLQRELKAEAARAAKQEKPDRGFIKQLNRQREGKGTEVVAKQKEFQPLTGQDFKQKKETTKVDFTNDPDKVEKSSPAKGFQLETHINTARKGLK